MIIAQFPGENSRQKRRIDSVTGGISEAYKIGGRGTQGNENGRPWGRPSSQQAINYAVAGRSPPFARPGCKSGLITCCTPSSGFDAGGGIGGSSLPSTR